MRHCWFVWAVTVFFTSMISWWSFGSPNWPFVMQETIIGKFSLLFISWLSFRIEFLLSVQKESRFDRFCECCHWVFFATLFDCIVEDQCSRLSIFNLKRLVAFILWTYLSTVSCIDILSTREIEIPHNRVKRTSDRKTIILVRSWVRLQCTSV